MTTTQKIIKYLALAFAVFLSISIISGICGALCSVALLLDGKTEKEIAERVIESGFANLDIDINAADLEIKTGEKFCVETSSKHLKYKKERDTLIINGTKPFFASPDGVKVVLTIPEETVFDRVFINAGAGNVIIDEITASSFEVELGAGEFIANRLETSDKTKIDGGAGSVTIKGGRLCNAEINMGIGKLDLKSDMNGKSSIDCGVGETNLVLTGTSDDYKIELDKSIGEVLIDGIKVCGDSVYGSGIRYINIDGGIGSLNITFAEKLPF